jgi:hypothetical protein
MLRPHVAIVPFLAALVIASLVTGCSDDSTGPGGGTTIYDTIRDTVKSPADTLRLHDTIHRQDTILIDTNRGGMLTGTIKGSVTLSDTACRAVTDVSGITVWVEGTSVQTTTDAEGKYTLTNVPSGILTIAFTKAGFGIQRRRNLQFVGGGTYYMGGSHIEQLSPHTAVTNPVTFTTTSGFTTFTFSGTISDIAKQPSRQINGWFFISRSPQIDYSDRSTYLGAYLAFPDNKNGMTAQVGTGGLYGLQPGDTAYILFCVANSCSQGTWDPGDGITDYVSLAPIGPQQGQKFVVQ